VAVAALSYLVPKLWLSYLIPKLWLSYLVPKLWLGNALVGNSCLPRARVEVPRTAVPKPELGNQS